MSPEFWIQAIQALTPVALGILILIAYRMRIRFLAKVFGHAGRKKDLKAAGRATRFDLAPLVKLVRAVFGR